MSDLILTARHAMGRKVAGEALVAHDGFSARYDLNRLTGVFSRPAHKLVGLSYVGRVLVLHTAKGGVASAWMLNEMRSRDMVPLAIVFNSVNPILVQGAALGGITMLAGFDVDVTALVPHGALVEIDPSARTLRVLDSRDSATNPANDNDAAAPRFTDMPGGPGGPQKVRFMGPH
jgi:predicted aconitase with swiveling domain